MSGVDMDGRMLRKGASASIGNFVRELGGILPANFEEQSDRISRLGARRSRWPTGSARLALSISKTS